MGNVEGEEADGDSDESEEADEATSGGGCLSASRRLLCWSDSCGGTDVNSLDWGVPGVAECEQPCASVADVAGCCCVTTASPMGSSAKACAYWSNALSGSSSCARAKSIHDSCMMLADRRGALGK